MAKTPAWTRKEGKNPEGGLNAKGRASYNAANPGKPGLKRPQPEGGSRRDSFCARMKGMKKKLTSAKTANDPNSRINKSLRAWNCKEGGQIKGNAMKKKVKRYQEGGMATDEQSDYGIAPATNPNAPSATSGYFSNTASTYPFQSSGSTGTSDTGSGVNQTFNIQPSAQAGEPTTMKRGGKVSLASKRADGCAIRGKTRA